MKILPYIIKPSAAFVKLLSFLIVLVLAILGFLGYLKPTLEFLDSDTLTFALGSINISLYQIIKRSIFLIGLLFFANMAVEKGKKYFKKLRKIKASNKSLVINIYQILVYFITFMIGMDILNIQLSNLAFFGGAIGIGLGFGLQKITSNFISGLILLFEKSIESGDLVELESGVYGFVRNTGARYTLIETLNGKEVMIPNEEFITKSVVNWTYSTKKGRIDIDVGVSYNCDIEKARSLMLEAAEEHELCSEDPKPDCLLKEYGDSSVNFTLHFWIDDITTKRRKTRSDVMRSIWKKLKDNNIEIPFPQRDVHIIKDEK